MLEIVQTSIFKKQLKQCRKRGWDLSALEEVVGMLQRRERGFQRNTEIMLYPVIASVKEIAM
jgi:mRNA-degrading endonuclease YafQ of YafQ-DinJ toxin-antitoxin module